MFHPYELLHNKLPVNWLHCKSIEWFQYELNSGLQWFVTILPPFVVETISSQYPIFIPTQKHQNTRKRKKTLTGNI